VAGVSASLCAAKARAESASADRLVLWYKQPAATWTEALPLGNGRLGAMVFGGAAEERLQLNEDTLWSGAPRDWNNPAAKQHLPEVRRLVLEQQDYVAADRVCREMQGPYNESYLPLADLRIAMDHPAAVVDYRRELDLDSALSRVSYQWDGGQFVREAFASAVDQVIVLRMTTTHPGGLNFEMALDSPLRSSLEASGDGSRLTGKAPSHVDPDYLKSNDPVLYDAAEGKGMRFEASALVSAEGGTVPQASASVSATRGWSPS
jgi:alpha-L-fucosidase 2